MKKIENTEKKYTIEREFSTEKTPESVLAKIIVIKNKKKLALPS